MSVLKPVRWREGMFLRPQHLQQHEESLKAREQARLTALHPHGWGLLQLELDEGQLANYVLQVRSLRGVTPDGTLLDVPDNARLPARSIEERIGEQGKPVALAVGLRQRGERQAQVDADDSEARDARYGGVEELAVDLDTGQREVPVERLVLNLRLFLGEEPTHGFDVLPLGRLQRTGDPARPVELDRRHAPPSLWLAAAPALHEPTRAVVERLALVLRELGGEAVGEAAPRNMLLYQTLAGALPVLRDIVSDARCHPREAYRELARLAGQLCQPAAGRTPDALPAYEHREPGPVFAALRDLILELSRPVIERRWVREAMERDGDLFRVALPETARTPGARVYLELHAAESAARLPALMSAAKIGAPGRIETLSTYALPGIPTEPQPGPPPELPPGPVGSWFRLRIEEAGEWTDQVLPAGQLAVFLLGCPPDVRANLVVVLPGG
jgi:type VI secretion system protein ImpJ